MAKDCPSYEVAVSGWLVWRKILNNLLRELSANLPVLLRCLNLTLCQESLDICV